MKYFETRILFFYLTVFSLSSCKTAELEKIKSLSDKPQENYFALTEGEIIAAETLSAVAIASIIVAHKYSHKKEFIKRFESSGTSAAMNQFHELPDDIKRTVLEKNLQKLRNLRELRHQKDPIKVLIVGASGGNGHKSAGESMKKSLEEIGGKGLFEVKYVDPWPSSFNQERWNNALKEENIQEIKKLTGTYREFAEGLLSTSLGRRIVKKNIQKTMEKPDVVIQAEHIGNVSLKKITDDLGAQHRLVPTDFGIEHFIRGATEKDSMKFRIDAFSPELIEPLTKKGITNAAAVGGPSRWEFLTLSEKLRSSKKEEAKKEILDTLSQLSDNKFREKDKSLLIMMGGTATNEKSVKAYLDGIVSNIESLTKSGEKIHVFAAQIVKYKTIEGKKVEDNQLKESLEKHLRDLEKNHPKIKEKLIFHPKAYLNAKEIASLMHQGVTLTKAGGGTAGELATMGGTAVFDMSLSQHIPWEKSNFEYLEKQKVGFGLYEQNSEKIGIQLEKAFEAKKQLKSSMPKNTFHLDWPQRVLTDLIIIEQQKLLNKKNILDVENNPTWNVNEKKVSQVDLNKIHEIHANPSLTKKSIFGISVITAFAATMGAAWIISPDKTKENIKENFHKALELNQISGGSCRITFLENLPFCISFHNSQEASREFCNTYPGTQWHKKSFCGTNYTQTCPISKDISLSFNHTQLSCQEVSEIIK